jgi:protein SCO1
MTNSSIRLSILVATLSSVIIGPGFVQNSSYGQKRIAKRPAKSKVLATFSCPMHPEVNARRAGRCPKCGMTLQVVKPPPESAAASPPMVQEAMAPVGSRLVVPDVELLNQDGRKVHFYSDLVQDRVVVINFIFTTCTTICPPLGATFARVQKELGDRAGREVRFVSISVDPVTDTPERLKAWGEKFHAGPAWTFVTGDRPHVNEVLRALGANSASPQDHSPTVLIVDDTRGQWTRTYGLAPPSQLIKLINNAIVGNLVVREGAQQ